MAELRFIQDFPAKGVKFIDISPKLTDKNDFKAIIAEMTSKVPANTDFIIAPESRGYIFGTAMAINLGLGFVPIRKPNKLPADTIKESYSLEYGTDTIEMHADAIKEGDRVLVIDDLLATGGTAVAACNLVKKVGAEVVAAAFIIELDPLKGREKIEAKGVKVVSMLNYDLD